MNLALEKAGLVRYERREHPRATPDRRQPTPLQSWLRQYGPLMGLSLMGLSAVVVIVVLLCVGAWT